MNEVTQKEWEWMSQGDIFKRCWKEAFDRNWKGGQGGELVPEPPPATIAELLECDPGVIHVAGMIVQGCEAMFEGKSVFFRNPETLLHPATERYIVGMLKAMLEMCGGRGVITETEKGPEKVEKPKRNRKNKTPTPTEEGFKGKSYENPDNIKHCVEWLSKFPENKEIAQLGNTRLTAPQLTEEINKNTLAGKQIVDIFVSKRDGTSIDEELHKS